MTIRVHSFDDANTQVERALEEIKRARARLIAAIDYQFAYGHGTSPENRDASRAYAFDLATPTDGLLAAAHDVRDARKAYERRRRAEILAEAAGDQ